MPVVAKTSKGNFGTYADLASLIAYVERDMQCTVSFDTRYHDEGRITVISIVVPLKGGVSEGRAFPTCETPVFWEGSNTRLNQAQAYGSAFTYACRYSLLGACGLSATDDDAQTSGTPQRDLHLMGDDTKQRIDLMLAECNVPPGQQSAYLSRIAGMRVDYVRLTEPVAQRILASYTQHRQQTTTEETK